MRHTDQQMNWAHACEEAGFRDVEVEPLLIPLEGEQMDHKTAKTEADARSDVRVRGFYGNRQNAFFGFRVFYSFASSYVSETPSQLYERFEKSRAREYEQRINEVDCGNFTPMIMSSTGGMGPRMTAALKLLASRLAFKKNESYAQVITMLRCRLTFAAARSALVCLRGSRGVKNFHVGRAGKDTPAILARSDLRC